MVVFKPEDLSNYTVLKINMLSLMENIKKQSHSKVKIMLTMNMNFERFKTDIRSWFNNLVIPIWYSPLYCHLHILLQSCHTILKTWKRNKKQMKSREKVQVFLQLLQSNHKNHKPNIALQLPWPVLSNWYSWDHLSMFEFNLPSHSTGILSKCSS